MNYLWGGMILIGIIYGAASGNWKEVTEAALDSSKEAVSLCVTMAGVTAMWVGLMRIAENSGLIAGMVRRMNPLLTYLFPEIPQVPKGVASNEMCTFLILNISSLQLIPVNIIAYRTQYGSVNPAAIVGPAIVATAVSTGVAVLYCKVKNRKRGRS